MAAKKKAPVHKSLGRDSKFGPVQCGNKGWGVTRTDKWSRTTCKNCLRNQP